LVKSLNPQGNPPGNLAINEAESIFQDLRKKELLLPSINMQGDACYLLNECKEDEWHTAIKDSVKPWFMKSPFLKTTGKVILWAIGSLLGGYLGSFGGHLADPPTATSMQVTK
jgi:hypothetical protein